MHTGHDQKRYLRTSRQQFGDVVMSQLRNVLSWGGVVNGRTSSTTIANQAAVCERSTSLAYLALARLLTRIVVALTQVPLRFHCSKTQLFHFSNSTKSSYSSEHRGIKNAKNYTGVGALKRAARQIASNREAAVTDSNIMCFLNTER